MWMLAAAWLVHGGMQTTVAVMRNEIFQAVDAQKLFLNTINSVLVSWDLLTLIKTEYRQSDLKHANC